MTAMPDTRQVPTSAAIADAPLAQMIRIGAGFTRSINLARDRDALELLRTYVPTSRAVGALEQLVAGLVTGRARKILSRALALIGPFGSGKSAFGLFVSALFASPDSPVHRAAIDRLQRAALERLTAHLDQLSLDDLIARIERLSEPMRAHLFQRLAPLMISLRN